jgi:DNA-binding SARP family transcriptional activator
MSIDSREQELVTTRLLRDQVDDQQWISEHLDVLWPTELLPGWYDDWVVFERERLSILRLHALEHCASVLAHGPLRGAALQLALEAVRAEPLRETANASLIEVYLAEGNVSDAVHHYDRFRDLLRRELGVDPSPALAELMPRRRFVDARVTTHRR